VNVLESEGAPSQAALLLEKYRAVSDEEIASRVLAGEQQLFELVMRRHNQRIYRTVRSILRDEHETLDVMQEAYLNAYAHLRDFDGRAKLSTWLTRIAVNAALGRLRRAGRFESLAEMDEEQSPMISLMPTPEQGASDLELRAILEAAIETLPPAFRTVFVLRVVEQMSVAETADTLDIPEVTVKTRLHRARGLLQRRLTDGVDAALPRLFGFHLTRCDRVVEGVFAMLRH
jgi:RNA polymerase sigma-70 factor, ECF subfamily